MARPVSLITPSYVGDLERFSLLCDSIDRHVSGYERHYVIVSDDDLPLFRPFASERRIVAPISRLIPRWLRLAPGLRLANDRKIWWSLRALPVHGWHVQQLVKIAAAIEMPEQRFCIIDSDIVFVRPFDVGAYAGGERTPLYVEPNAIKSDAPLHAVWTRSCDRLLGRAATRFPADDYIGHVIVWDKNAVRDMTRAIARATGVSWPLALCRVRHFSEYLLYGQYVRNCPERFAEHEVTTQSRATSYWEGHALDSAAIKQMVAQGENSTVALAVQSYSNTSVSVIRKAVGLLRDEDSAGSPEPLRAA